jgi:hypothetical protein
MLKSFGRVLQRLPGMFAPGLVILFAVMRSRHPVRMCSQIVKLSSPLMCILRQSLPFLMFRCSDSIAALLAEDPRSRLLLYFTFAVQMATVTLTIEKRPDLGCAHFLRLSAAIVSTLTRTVLESLAACTFLEGFWSNISSN